MIPTQIIIDLVEGDTLPALSVRFQGLNLSTYTSITMFAVRGDSYRFSRAVTPDGTDPELGTVTWQSGDLVRGRMKMEFEFVTGAGRFTLPQRYPIIADVRGDLA